MARDDGTPRKIRRKTPVCFAFALVFFWSCFGLTLLIQKKSKRKPKEDQNKRRTRPKQDRKETVRKLHSYPQKK